MSSPGIHGVSADPSGMDTTVPSHRALSVACRYHSRPSPSPRQVARVAGQTLWVAGATGALLAAAMHFGAEGIVGGGCGTHAVANRLLAHLPVTY